MKANSTMCLHVQFVLMLVDGVASVGRISLLMQLAMVDYELVYTHKD